MGMFWDLSLLLSGKIFGTWGCHCCTWHLIILTTTEQTKINVLFKNIFLEFPPSFSQQFCSGICYDVFPSSAEIVKNGRKMMMMAFPTRKERKRRQNRSKVKKCPFYKELLLIFPSSIFMCVRLCLFAWFSGEEGKKFYRRKKEKAMMTKKKERRKLQTRLFTFTCRRLFYLRRKKFFHDLLLVNLTPSIAIP